MDKQYVVGVDIGGQTSKIGVVDSYGVIVGRTVIRTDAFSSDAGAYVDALAAAIVSCVKESGKEGEIRGVGIGAPDANYYTGQIVNAPNIPWAAGKTCRGSGNCRGRARPGRA